LPYQNSLQYYLLSGDSLAKWRTTMTPNSWPALPLEEWKDTYATLHRWTQIVGKIRLALTPHRNHWWNTTLYVTPRGLTTSSMPYNDKLLQIDFDFIDHLLLIQTSDGSTQRIFLKPYPVAEFYKETMAALESLGMPVTIWPISRNTDRLHLIRILNIWPRSEYAHRVWRIIGHASASLSSSRLLAS
jgi:hypothetical protein